MGNKTITLLAFIGTILIIINRVIILSGVIYKYADRHNFPMEKIADLFRILQGINIIGFLLILTFFFKLYFMRKN